MEALLLVALGGGLGAVSRHLVGEVARTSAFPAATMLVNVIGSFIVAVVLFGAFESNVVLFVGIGFCGAFTTFSTFSVQTVTLLEEGKWLLAGIFAFGTAILGLLGFGLGWLLVA